MDTLDVVDSMYSPERLLPLGEWHLDPEARFLNHGSFGACPRVVLEAQARLREELERQPVRFLVRGLEARVDAAREEVATALGADPEGLLFVPNATAGANVALWACPLQTGDEVLISDHAYGAVRNAALESAAVRGAQVRTVALPFPLDDPAQWVEAWVGAVGPRSRLAVVDHITSPTAVVAPAARIASALESAGVAVLLDGAHAPGMVPLDIRAVGASWYVGNLHKWLFAPKGAGVLWVAPRWRERTPPRVVSHGHTDPRSDRPRLWREHDWSGTFDPTAWLAAPAGLAFASSAHPDGLGGLMRRNRALALWARSRLVSALGVAPSCPDECIGAMAALSLPIAGASEPSQYHGTPALQLALWERHRVEVPVIPWGEPGRALVRISAQAYNTVDDYEALVGALSSELG